MSKKCRAYSASKLGLEPADNRKAFYAGWDAAIAEAEKQEPFGYFQYAPHFDAWVQNRDSNTGVAFYTTPPAAQRQWVGLTPTDMEELSSEWWTPNENEMALINWVEAKLKEKNT